MSAVIRWSAVLIFAAGISVAIVALCIGIALTPLPWLAPIVGVAFSVAAVYVILLGVEWAMSAR